MPHTTRKGYKDKLLEAQAKLQEAQYSIQESFRNSYKFAETEDGYKNDLFLASRDLISELRDSGAIIDKTTDDNTTLIEFDDLSPQIIKATVNPTILQIIATSIDHVQELTERIVALLCQTKAQEQLIASLNKSVYHCEKALSIANNSQKALYSSGINTTESELNPQADG